jgi:hypothetical protein
MINAAKALDAPKARGKDWPPRRRSSPSPFLPMRTLSLGSLTSSKNLTTVQTIDTVSMQPCLGADTHG